MCTPQSRYIHLYLFKMSSKYNVTMPAGPESSAGAVGGGRSVGHVPGLCGTSTLQAHQGYGLLE